MLGSHRIGGYTIPARSMVLLFQWAVPRHPDSYFPFGAGPRKCIGYEFTLLEAQVVLAMLVQRFRVSLVPGYLVVPDPVDTAFALTVRTNPMPFPAFSCTPMHNQALVNAHKRQWFRLKLKYGILISLRKRRKCLTARQGSATLKRQGGG